MSERPMRDELIALAERCEAATGPDRELDCEIEIECGKDGPRIREIMAGSPHNTIFEVAKAADRKDGGVFFRVPRYTVSLDAAMTLVPEDAFWRLGHDGDGADPSEFRADVIVPRPGGSDPRGRAVAETPALALCSAALRAQGGSRE